jgi:hypothetical protein
VKGKAGAASVEAAGSEAKALDRQMVAPELVEIADERSGPASVRDRGRA